MSCEGPYKLVAKDPTQYDYAIDTHNKFADVDKRDGHYADLSYTKNPRALKLKGPLRPQHAKNSSEKKNSISECGVNDDDDREPSWHPTAKDQFESASVVKMQLDQHAKQREFKFRISKYECKVTITSPKRTAPKWHITTVVLEHNHDLSSKAIGSKPLSDSMRAIIEKAVSKGLSARDTLVLLTLDHPNESIDRKRVANYAAQFKATNSSPQVSESMQMPRKLLKG
ncbi:hypothetical protein BGZ51_007517 [Haplosporangium sp. Z 767]|nr:hypothetical protein BGZ51_007517 [Haplosporangium sp. Z 767]